MNPQKIIFLINTKTSYQNEFFQNLSKIYSIKVLVISKNYKNYNFKIKKNSFYEHLSNFTNKKKKNFIYNKFF